MAFYLKRKLHNYFKQARISLKDVIAIKFFDKNIGQGACITWGRLYNNEELLSILKIECLKQGFKDIELLEYAYSLQDIARYPCFYEQWIYFAQQVIPYQSNYKNWVRIKRQFLLDGRDIKFLGCNAKKINKITNI